MLAVAALTLFAALPVEAGSSNDPFGPRSIQSGSLRIAAANETSATAIEKMTKQDFDRLVKRLTKTKALGLFAKMALKGDAQKFLAELARFHGGGGNATIDEIEERYHLMVHKLLASLKKKDATLAQEIAAYRDMLWNMLADAEAFAALG
jgi:hypothetical protein